MTFERWQLMETLSTRWITIAMIGAILLLMALAIVAQSINKRQLRRRLLIGLSAAFVIFIAGGLGMWRYCQPYLTLRHYVTPRVRVARPEFFGLVPESGTTIGLSAGTNNYKDLDRLPMYDRHLVTQDVTYLGLDKTTTYFIMNTRLYSYSGPVRFEAVAHARLSGYRYTLNDARYQALGFINPTKYSTRALVVPRHQQGLTYDLPNASKVYYLQTAGFRWTTETASSLDQVN
ncbi:hypothetical protein [Lacticaseibacillus daqingensis]|uniref:hypothetical protein n=1 Tax=Lacticaseibacillus daqingensis TaxID=2486014 RepID=UPI000F7A39D6|nr:hypothetical protein [Lacticaseibacillus daqingensis]